MVTCGTTIFWDAREARPDAWGGVGVFATQRIPKGELVESGVVQRLCHGKVNENDGTTSALNGTHFGGMKLT